MSSATNSEVRYVLGTTELKVKIDGGPPQVVLHYWVTSSEPNRTLFPERLAWAFNPKTARRDIPKVKKLAAEFMKISPRQIELDTPLERYSG